MSELPADEIMRQMARIAMERTTTFFAKSAREIAATMSDEVSGKDALEAFARTIESRNADLYPKGRES